MRRTRVVRGCLPLRNKLASTQGVQAVIGDKHKETWRIMLSVQVVVPKEQAQDEWRACKELVAKTWNENSLLLLFTPCQRSFLVFLVFGGKRENLVAPKKLFFSLHQKHERNSNAICEDISAPRELFTQQNKN